MGSQRHERAGWNGPAPLLLSLAAGSNALAPYRRGKGRDTPRHRRAAHLSDHWLSAEVPISGRKQRTNRGMPDRPLEPRYARERLFIYEIHALLLRGAFDNRFNTKRAIAAGA